jgi:hypothetical protein
VDAAHAIVYEQAKGVTWGQPVLVPAHSLQFLDTIKAVRLSWTVELESLFEAKWHNPNTTNVLDKDEDKDKVVVKVEHTPWSAHFWLPA